MLTLIGTSSDPLLAWTQYLFSIKLAGSTAIVIHYFVHYHYFEHVISYKFYFTSIF